MTNRTELAAAVEPLDSNFARMIRADKTEVEQVPTPFLVNGAIYRVTHLLPTRPVVFTVGCVGSDAVLLAGRPEAYAILADVGGVRLDDDDARLAYAVTFLETTRSFGERFQILSSVDDILPRHRLEPGEMQRLEALRARLRDQVAPSAISGNDPWEVIVFAIHGRALEQIKLVLDSDGSIVSTRETLEPDLPIAYAF
jgi:hypothetical protein